MRFAILGLFNSKSTVLAGMMHRLGANMAPPFWMNCKDNAEDNFYEPYDLSWHLRKWWDQPNITEMVSADMRTNFLRRWVELQECTGSAPVGAKHPLLTLCWRELLLGWGEDVRLIWAFREFDESVIGLQKRDWFRGLEKKIQQRLWDELVCLEGSNNKLVRVNWNDVRSNPEWAACHLASLIGLVPTAFQLKTAASFVVTESVPVQLEHRNPIQ